MRQVSFGLCALSVTAFLTVSTAEVSGEVLAPTLQLVKQFDRGSTYSDFGTSQGLMTGSNLGAEIFTDGIFRSLLFYDLTSIDTTGLDLASATLSLTPTQNNGADTLVGAINLSWTTGDSDQTLYTRAGDLSSTQAIPASATTEQVLDVTALVNSWLSNPATNHGFGLISVDEDEEPARIFAVSPMLTLEFVPEVVGVPEPAMAGLLAASVVGLLAKRSRR
jgi:hypothetical protein